MDNATASLTGVLANDEKIWSFIRSCGGLHMAIQAQGDTTVHKRAAVTELCMAKLNRDGLPVLFSLFWWLWWFLGVAAGLLQKAVVVYGLLGNFPFK